MSESRPANAPPCLLQLEAPSAFLQLEEAPSALCSWRLAAAAPRAGAGSWAAAAHHAVARRLGDEREQQLRLVEEVDRRELLGVEDADLAVRLAGGGGGTVRRWCGVTCAWAWYGRNAASVEAAGCDLVTWKVALMRGRRYGQAMVRHGLCMDVVETTRGERGGGGVRSDHLEGGVDEDREHLELLLRVRHAREVAPVLDVRAELLLGERQRLAEHVPAMPRERGGGGDARAW